MHHLHGTRPCQLVVTEWMDEKALVPLSGVCEVLYRPKLVDDRAALLAAVADADGLIVRNRTQVDTELLSQAPHLRVVGRLGVGLDNIDVAACHERSISVCPAVGANARSVAEYVLCSAMMLLRGAFSSTASVTAGGWPRAALGQGREAAGKTLGIVGFGSVGQMTARLALAAGLRVTYVGPPPKGVDADVGAAGCIESESLDDLLRQADVVSLHVPLTSETRGLFDASRLARMKPGAILINSARGGIVDDVALAAAVRAGRLGGAAVDVFELEPLSPDNPWHGCPNVLLTPHIAGLTQESNLRVSYAVAAAVGEVLARR